MQAGISLSIRLQAHHFQCSSCHVLCHYQCCFEIYFVMIWNRSSTNIFSWTRKKFKARDLNRIRNFWRHILLKELPRTSQMGGQYNTELVTFVELVKDCAKDSLCRWRYWTYLSIWTAVKPNIVKTQLTILFHYWLATSYVETAF